RLSYVLEALPQVPVYDGAEIFGVHETDQPIVVGHDQSAVHGVHPLDGKLHTPAAAEHTGRWVDMKDPLRRNGNLTESFKLWVGEEKIEVGHISTFVT